MQKSKSTKPQINAVEPPVYATISPVHLSKNCPLCTDVGKIIDALGKREFASCNDITDAITALHLAIGLIMRDNISNYERKKREEDAKVSDSIIPIV